MPKTNLYFILISILIKISSTNYIILIRLQKAYKNVVVVACKLWPALKKATDYKLKVARKKQCNRKKIVKKQKTETMATKCHRNWRRFILLSGKKKNYEGDIKDYMDQYQANDKYLLQLWVVVGRKL